MTQFPDNSVQTGPDRGWSWVVAFAACFNSLVLAGIFRTSGVLFVAFINTYGVTREEASWPVVVCISVLNLTGPFSGLLGQKYGIRPVAMAGALIATIGISSCYFTTSLRIITLLFGVVFGIGYGLVSTLMPVIVNFYFLNLRATANGIANSGSCFGSLILPPFFELLISTYGLSGCFLLTGGMVLHIAIASALLRPPPWLERNRKETRTLQIASFYRKEATNQDVSCQQLRDVPPYNSHSDIIRVPTSVENGTRGHEKNNLFSYSLNAKSSSDPQYETQLKHTDPDYILEPKSAEYNVSESLHNEHHNSFENIPYSQAVRTNNMSGWRNKEFIPSKDMPLFQNLTTECEFDETKSLNQNIETLIYPNERKAVLRKSMNRKDKTVSCSKLSSLDFDRNGHQYNTSDIQHVEIPIKDSKYECLEETERVEFLYNARANCHVKSSFTVLDSFIAILTCPMFYVTAVTNVSFYFLYHMYVVIIVDYALDRSVPEDNTKYIIFAFSISDLFGRLCLGWITDRQFLRRSHFVMGCMAIIGLVFFCFPFASSYWSLIAASCCYGLLLGTTMVVFPILLVDFLGTELHAVAYGCMCFMNGITSFARPFLIGYFRDTLGSYSNMFFVLGIISVTASSLWLLEKCFIRQNDSKEDT